MIVEYPDWLPLAQKSGKNITKDTGFRTDQPTVGAPIFQKLTDDLKASFSVTFICTAAQHRAFYQWLRSPNYLDNCNRWFRIKVSTGTGESGVEEQVLHFTSYPQFNQSGSIFTWTGNVVAKQIISADDDLDDIIIELPAPWRSWLDVIVTETLPRSE